MTGFIEPDPAILVGAPAALTGSVATARRLDYPVGEIHWWNTGDAVCGCHRTVPNPCEGNPATWTMEGQDPIFDPHPDTAAETFIQWKGTEVCMDFHCPCGHHSHFDAAFAYWVKCAGCGTIYKLGTQVRVFRREWDGGSLVEDETGYDRDDGCECPGCTRLRAAGGERPA